MTGSAQTLARFLRDGGASTTCGACIYPTDTSGNFTNVGPIYNTLLPGMYVSSAPNTGGCIQLMEPTTGPACAVALDNTTSCYSIACGQDQTCTQTNYDTCATDVTSAGGACATAAASQSACQAFATDGGAYDSCAAADDTGLTYIINLFCGDTNDAGTP